MPERLIEPLHEWQVVYGNSRSYVMLTKPDPDALAEFGRPGVALLFLTELWVPPNVRGRGHAHTLIAAAVAWAKQAGVDLWLYCSPYGPGQRPDATALSRLYAKHGFKVVRKKPDLDMVLRA